MHVTMRLHSCYWGPTLQRIPTHACRLKRRCQVAARITPGRVRHLMVTFANNNPAVFGGREDVVASMMGHHVRMWREVYDKAVNVRSVRLAAEAVAAVRAAVETEMAAAAEAAQGAARMAEEAAAVLAAAAAVGADAGDSDEEYVSAVAAAADGGEEVVGPLAPAAEAADEEAAAAEMDVSEDEELELVMTSDDEDDVLVWEEAA